MVTRVPTLNRRQSAARFRQLQRAGCKPKRVRLPNGDVAVVKSKDCPLDNPLHDNPKQPPKRWWRGCVRGVRDSGSGADPQRVCGDLWYNRLSASKRREILKSEGKMLANPRNERAKRAADKAYLTVMERGGTRHAALVAAYKAAVDNGVAPSEAQRYADDADLYYRRFGGSWQYRKGRNMEENPALWQARSHCLSSAPRAGRGKSKARTAYNAAHRAYIEAIKDDLGSVIAYQDAYDRAVFHLRHEKAARHIADCIHRDQKTSRRRNMQANPCPDGTCPNAGASYAPNQAGGGLTTALLIGGALLAGWLLLKPKPASAATPPGQQPGLPPGGPAVCPINKALLDAWGLARGYSVIYIEAGTMQNIEALVAQIPTLVEGMQLGNQYVIVLGDGSFWTPTGVPPVAGAAPAQKDDYCAWAAQQPQTGTPPVQAPSQTENGAPQAPSQMPPPNPVLPAPGSPLWTAEV